MYEDTNLQLLYHENLSCVISSYFSHSLEFRTIVEQLKVHAHEMVLSQMLDFSFLKKLGMHFHRISFKVFLFLLFRKKCGGCDNSAYTQLVI